MKSLRKIAVESKRRTYSSVFVLDEVLFSLRILRVRLPVYLQRNGFWTTALTISSFALQKLARAHTLLNRGKLWVEHDCILRLFPLPVVCR